MKAYNPSASSGHMRRATIEEASFGQNFLTGVQPYQL